MSRPLFESLESRQLFAAAPLPDLTAQLNFTPPVVVPPGMSIAPSLKITNAGGAMDKAAFVPIRLYASPTRTLAPNAVPFDIIRKPMKLGAGQSRTVNLTSKLPSVTTDKTYFLIVQVNNGKQVKESNLKNNFVTSRPIANPVGTFTGTFTSTDGRPGTLTLRLYSEADPEGKTTPFFIDFTSTSDGVTIRRTHLRSAITKAGRLTSSSGGGYTDANLGRVSYHIGVDGKLNGKSLTGTVHLAWHTTTQSRNAVHTFKLARV